MLSKINNKSVAGFLICLVAFSSCWSVCNAQSNEDDDYYDEPVDVAVQDCPETARELCIEFRALRDLIPSRKLISITQRHYECDRKFRKAMKFLQTPTFTNVIRQIEDSEVYQQLLQPFADAGVNTEILASITSLLNCLQLPVNINNKKNGRSGSRPLQSYGMEVFASIPRQQFKDLLGQILGSNSQFAAFYRIVRNSTYQRLVMNALSSSELEKPLRVLKKYYIDVRPLLAEIFELFSWGPSDF